MNNDENIKKNRERLLRQYRSTQGRSPKQYGTSAKCLKFACIVLLILIIYILWH